MWGPEALPLCAGGRKGTRGAMLPCMCPPLLHLASPPPPLPNCPSAGGVGRVDNPHRMHLTSPAPPPPPPLNCPSAGGVGRADHPHRMRHAGPGHAGLPVPCIARRAAHHHHRAVCVPGAAGRPLLGEHARACVRARARACVRGYVCVYAIAAVCSWAWPLTAPSVLLVRVRVTVSPLPRYFVCLALLACPQ